MLTLLGFFFCSLITWTFTQTVELDIRLQNGLVPYAGRVEIKHNGVWGRLCENNWDLRIGDVICRQLGYLAAISVPCCHAFGRASGPLWLDGVHCTGNESSITACTHNAWGVETCSYMSDASVVCKAANISTNITQVRLTGAPGLSAGRIEVLFAGIWGDVGMFNWDISDGHVVCRSLGYPAGALTVVYRCQDVFGASHLITWLNNVQCRGNETSLVECGYVRETYKSTFGYNAGIVCDVGNKTAVQIRLNGSVSHAGRVEVRLAGVWGTIWAEEWDLQDAHVICRQLGHQAAELAVSSATLVFTRTTSKAQWINHVSCTGNESSLSKCHHNINFRSGRNPDAGVVCKLNSSEPKLRLRGSALAFVGRVEVLYGGLWGSIHNSGWDIRDANVSCRELGYEGALMSLKYGADAFSGSRGPVWLSDVQCDGEEPSLANCSFSRISGAYLLHDNDAAVVCKSDRDNVAILNGTQVRINGSIAHAGRVEILFLGLWGTISGSSWSIADGDVVCIQLGYSRALASLSFDAFGPGTGPVWLKDVGCHGNETRLTQCPHSDWLSSSRGDDEGAGVVCESTGQVLQNFQVRLTGGSAANAGRVEVRYLGVWGSIVHVISMHSFGAVVCRQLGYAQPLNVFRDAASLFGRGVGPVWMTHVRCKGNETSVEECWYEKSFHNRIPEVAVICRHNVETTASPASPHSTVATTRGRQPSSGVQSSTHYVLISLSVTAAILVLVILLFCYIRRCKRTRGKYDPRTELDRLDIVNNVMDNEVFPYSSKNAALEVDEDDGKSTSCTEDCSQDLREIPERQISQRDTDLKGETFKV